MGEGRAWRLRGCSPRRPGAAGDPRRPAAPLPARARSGAARAPTQARSSGARPPATYGRGPCGSARGSPAGGGRAPLTSCVKCTSEWGGRARPRASSPAQRRGDRPEQPRQRHFLHRPAAAAAAAATTAAAGPRPEVNALLRNPFRGAPPAASRWTT